MNRFPLSAVAVAVLVGLVAMFLPSVFLGREVTVVVIAVVYAAAGLLVALLWPDGSWWWGVWVAAPVILIVAFSNHNPAYPGAFLRHDVPLLATVSAAACLGALLGARLSPRNRAREQASASEPDS